MLSYGTGFAIPKMSSGNTGFFQNSRYLKKRREDNVSIRNVAVAVDCNNQCFDGCFVGHQVKAAVPLFPIISKGEV